MNKTTTTRNTINSRDHRTVVATSFDVLADPKPKFGDPVVAIMVEPKGGAEKFILPMDLRTARDLSIMLLDTVMQVSPAVALELMRP
jgi:hypothetical protein